MNLSVGVLWRKKMKFAHRNVDIVVSVKLSPVFSVLCLLISAGSGLFNNDKISLCSA